MPLFLDNMFSLCLASLAFLRFDLLAGVERASVEEEDEELYGLHREREPRAVLIPDIGQ